MRLTAETDKLLDELVYSGTALVLFLSVITFGLFPAHYVFRQTFILNEYLPPERRLPELLAGTLLVLVYLDVAVALLYTLHPAPVFFHVCVSMPLILIVLFQIWTWKVRSRVHELFEIQPRESMWLFFLPTLLFGYAYFNYRVNGLWKLSQQHSESPAVASEDAGGLST